MYKQQKFDSMKQHHFDIEHIQFFIQSQLGHVDAWAWGRGHGGGSVGAGAVAWAQGVTVYIPVVVSLFWLILTK